VKLCQHAARDQFQILSCTIAFFKGSMKQKLLDAAISLREAGFELVATHP
jgi:hypothetical protein